METNNLSKTFEEVSFKEFLTKYQVVIPMVQRDYAQGRITNDVNRIRNRFLEAIKDSLLQDEDNITPLKLDFVYGEITKVWDKEIPEKLEKLVITPLDGQQRLTTLYLLHWYASRLAKNISAADYDFLRKFTYDIRPSSRDFCNKLIDFEPAENVSLQKQIEDQNWFEGEWYHDPTILSMLVMLDEIQKKFKSIPNLWEILTSDKPRILFYFLPLAENGLSDELYIKMNSRGKKLTPFEHFKAEYEDLYERDSEEANVINHKFDVEWADVLFEYRDPKDDTIDKEWMRYFFYISHILCYQQSIEKSADEFQLIDDLYKNNPKATQNKKYLEKAFDCWYHVKNTHGNIDEFFDKYLSGFEYVKGKVATYKSIEQYRGKQNFFHACVKLYNPNSNYSYGFSYGDFLFLFGIITYLINQDKIKEEDFVERLRILRNLISNSNAGEIRGDSDYMKDLLTETTSLILNGQIEESLDHKFNKIQEDDERVKMKLKPTMTEADLDLMYKFEDHPLIYGYVSGFGFNNLDKVDTFYSTFNVSINFLLIHQAMIALGDYRQYDNNKKRYYMGNWNHSTWSKLLHSSRYRQGFHDNTMRVLNELLDLEQKGLTLTDITQQYITSQASQKTYTWRYYFAKYSDMLRGQDGELTCEDDKYEWETLNKHQFNGQHWKSFLNVIYNKICKKLHAEGNEEHLVELPNYGDNLSILNPISSLDCQADKFIYYIDDKSIEWEIPQNKEGIDIVDRIEFGVSKIMDILSKKPESTTTA